MKPRVSAVIISFKRLNYVQRIIASLRAQTRRPDDIIVADGGSGDELLAWLNAQPDVITLRVPDSGSAGSSAAGMRWALEHGSDWVWVFDDDEIAAPDALAVLLTAGAAHPEIGVLNSMCVGIEDTTRPAIGAVCLRTNPNDYLNGRYLYTRDEIMAHADKDGLVDTLRGQFFQGVMFHRSVLEKIGLPLPFLFTRGDELEYALRVMRAGYHIYIVPASVVRHPLAPIRFLKILGATRPVESMSAKKRYYSIRNSIYIRRAYYGHLPFMPYVARRLAAACFTELLLDPTKSIQERFQACGAAWRGTLDGLRLADGAGDAPATRSPSYG